MPEIAQAIYLDIGSIHNEILRRHPEITKSAGYLNRASTDTAWAVICDTSECVEGKEIEIYHTDTEDYHGFTVEIVRWRVKPQPPDREGS